MLCFITKDKATCVHCFSFLCIFLCKKNESKSSSSSPVLWFQTHFELLLHPHFYFSRLWHLHTLRWPKNNLRHMSRKSSTCSGPNCVRMDERSATFVPAPAIRTTLETILAPAPPAPVAHIYMGTFDKRHLLHMLRWSMHKSWRGLIHADNLA